MMEMEREGGVGEGLANTFVKEMSESAAISYHYGLTSHLSITVASICDMQAV